MTTADTTNARSASLSELGLGLGLGLDDQNHATLGRLLVSGSVAVADEDSGGRMRARIRVVPDQMIWEPSVLVLSHSGDLDSAPRPRWSTTSPESACWRAPGTAPPWHRWWSRIR